MKHHSLLTGCIVLTLYMSLKMTWAKEVPGPCPDRDTMSGFKVSQFLGLWFEVQRYKYSMEDGLSCVESANSPLPNGRMDIRNTGISPAQVALTVSGTAYAPDDLYPGKLVWQVKGAPVAFYWILDTDYYNYAVVWSCVPLFFAHEEMTWVFSRERRGLDPDAQAAVALVLQKNDMDASLFINTTQTKCNN